LDGRYIDLWSMDNCIAYLIIRIACLGILSACIRLGVSEPTSTTVASVSCVGLFGALIVKNGMHQWASHVAGYLDGGCPFSSRNRLLGAGTGGLLLLLLLLLPSSLILDPSLSWQIVLFHRRHRCTR
jgi:hypothetical protein